MKPLKVKDGQRLKIYFVFEKEASQDKRTVMSVYQVTCLKFDLKRIDQLPPPVVIHRLALEKEVVCLSHFGEITIPVLDDGFGTVEHSPHMFVAWVGSAR